MDTLSRLSHDTDQEVAMGAIVAMGLIGGGTNNARIAGMLRNLSSYYYKEPNLLFTVRIAQVRFRFPACCPVDFRPVNADGVSNPRDVIRSMCAHRVSEVADSGSFVLHC